MSSDKKEEVKWIDYDEWKNHMNFYSLSYLYKQPVVKDPTRYINIKKDS